MGGNDEVCTPLHIVAPILKHFGPIGLDPASNPRSVVPAHTRYMLDTEPYTTINPRTQKEVIRYRLREDARFNERHETLEGAWYADGLVQSWGGHGLVWLNSPWSQLGTKKGSQWITKCAEEADEAFHMTKAAMSTDWFHDFVVPTKDAIMFFKKRIKFEGEENSAPFGVALSYYGKRVDLFAKVFGEKGWVVG